VNPKSWLGYLLARIKHNFDVDDQLRPLSGAGIHVASVIFLRSAKIKNQSEY